MEWTYLSATQAHDRIHDTGHFVMQITIAWLTSAALSRIAV